MGIGYDLGQARRDYRRLGAGFAMGGLRARKAAPSADRFAVEVPGVGRVFVRKGHSDFNTLRQVFREHDYDLGKFPAAKARVQARYEAILAAGRTPVIVDAGANIGAATRWFKSVYPKAAVVAVEPEPNNAEMLRLNVAALDGVTVLEAAIGAESGFVALSHQEESWGVQTTRAESGLPIVTVDEALAKVPAGDPLIVKVDIEGFESDLFARNTGWIDRAYAVFIEPHDWMLPGQGSSRSFQRAMAAHDFELFLLGENLIYVRG